SPRRVGTAWVDMILNRNFLSDVAWSSFRIIAGFLIAALMAVPLGLLMGSFEVVRSFFQPPISFIRYMPASAFIPLLILLIGLDENEKLIIIWIGVFFQLFLPATFPEVVDALRITMGWAWTYLIVAEIVSAERGIGSFILISERFLRSDRII